ncbi:hypothetical protein ACN42_g7462 [Penicillium freii]|uniref:Uncharacterized protein n=1 Tax=Penicillium freii TaxID=48697 RepID=A0A101MFX3_PENFR|nr:hypothetical protein ACN42_g7462 [Penicillium freii]
MYFHAHRTLKSPGTDTFELLILSIRALFDIFAHACRLIPAGSRPCRVLDAMDHVPRVVVVPAAVARSSAAKRNQFARDVHPSASIANGVSQ